MARFSFGPCLAHEACLPSTFPAPVFRNLQHVSSTSSASGFCAPPYLLSLLCSSMFRLDRVGPCVGFFVPIRAFGDMGLTPPMHSPRTLSCSIHHSTGLIRTCPPQAMHGVSVTKPTLLSYVEKWRRPICSVVMSTAGNKNQQGPKTDQHRDQHEQV